ncbi:MAG: transaldolase [Chloroflexi bacterium]|nr:transaldolase [Chloroflexota bacterium]
MTIYLDTANLEEIKKANDWGVLGGVTTNPLLMAKEPLKVSETLHKISNLGFAEIFYQPHQTGWKEIVREAKLAKEIVGSSLVVKIPPLASSFPAVKALGAEQKICITAVFSVLQALLAKEVGATYVAIYVNRASRLLGDGLALTSDVAAVLGDSTTSIIAASIKSPQEAMQAYLSGAAHITLPFNVLERMFEHEVTKHVIEGFVKNGAGIL